MEELVDHPSLLALIDVFQFDHDFADLLRLLGRKLIEHGIGRGRIEAGDQDSRLANSVVGKAHCHLNGCYIRSFSVHVGFKPHPARPDGESG